MEKCVEREKSERQQRWRRRNKSRGEREVKGLRWKDCPREEREGECRIRG